MLIRNGDIVVLSGPMREAYHAVPKILKTPEVSKPSRESLDYVVPGVCSCQNKNKCIEFHNLEHNMKAVISSDLSDYNIYLQTSRINMNVRQVLHPKHILQKVLPPLP